MACTCLGDVCYRLVPSVSVCAGLFSLGRHCLIRELEMHGLVHGKTTVLVTLLIPEQYV